TITLLTTIMGDSMHAISRLPYPFIGFLARPDGSAVLARLGYENKEPIFITKDIDACYQLSTYLT
ncbi:hypothetical protein SAMN05660297_03637, partial [Natronincola peptidivorans]